MGSGSGQYDPVPEAWWHRFPEPRPRRASTGVRGCSAAVNTDPAACGEAALPEPGQRRYHFSTVDFRRADPNNRSEPANGDGSPMPDASITCPYCNAFVQVPNTPPESG